MTTPGYWMNETSGVLEPAVMAYVHGHPMTKDQIAAMRAYLRQWINGDWHDDGATLIELRAEIDGLTSSEAIRAWLDKAESINIDPL